MKFSNVNNITELLKYRVPSQSANVIKDISNQANLLEQRLYLVGGSPRDIFLAKKITDLDFAIDGDPINLANSLPNKLHAKLIAKSQFGTIKLQLHNHTIDVARTRNETYAKPGALPTVSNSSIEEDLARRDFSINSIAVSLSNPDWGNILDPYGGRKDLDNRLIRILHPGSFNDDPTRIFRAIRYEQRLGFTIEKKTKKALLESIEFIHSISGERLRSEFRYIFDEPLVLDILERGRFLPILTAIHLGFQSFNTKEIHEALRTMPKYYVNHFDQVHNLIYLAFLAYYLTPEESVQFIKKLSMPKSWKQIVRDTISVRSIIPEITRINLKESSLFKYLRGHCYEAILANRLLTKSECAKKRLDKFIKVLQYMKPELSGFELQKMGVPNGPLIGQLLSEIMVQKLDGLIKSKKEEVKLIENATNPKGLSFDIDHRSGGPESGI